MRFALSVNLGYFHSSPAADDVRSEAAAAAAWYERGVKSDF